MKKDIIVKKNKNHKKFNKTDKVFILIDKKFDKIDKKLISHDKKFDKIDKKLISHDKEFIKINLKLVNHDKKFAKIDRKLISHDKRFDRQMNAILDNKKDIEWIKENMVTKQDHQEVLNILDYIASTVNNIRQDHFSAIEWLKRHEMRITKLEVKI